MKKHIYLAVILALIFTSCSTEKEDPNLESQYPEGSVFGPSGPTIVIDVMNPSTGKTWMDRNLGATQAATSSTDAASYGDLYQWGRGSDGHQLRNSGTTTTRSGIDQPAHGSFITVSSDRGDWRSPQNPNLWQGVSGKNNPCPTGYRIPTSAEWEEEQASWGVHHSSIGAFASLKLPLAGKRLQDGSLFTVGNAGNYWSSTVSTGNNSGLRFRALFFNNGVGGRGTYRAAEAASVRCIKN